MQVHMQKWFSQMADSNGDGTGTTNLIGDYSSAETVFKVQPTGSSVLIIHRLIAVVEDSGTFNADDYGGISNGLTNGISMSLVDDSGEIIDLVSGGPIKTNSDWQAQCYDLTIQEFSGNPKSMVMRWTFSKAGVPLKLEAEQNQRIEMTLNDDFTGLVRHKFCFQGYEYGERY